MTYKTHVVGGIFLGLLVAPAVPNLNPIIIVGASAIGFLLPDLDHPNSYLNNRIPIPNPLTLFKHRGFTHSILFTVIVALLLNSLSVTLTIGIATGIISHMLLDMFNPTGVELFYPYHKRYSIARISTSSVGEYVFLVGMVGMIYGYFRLI